MQGCFSLDMMIEAVKVNTRSAVADVSDVADGDGKHGSGSVLGYVSQSKNEASHLATLYIIQSDNEEV
jgi:hypothetical protein